MNFPFDKKSFQEKLQQKGLRLATDKIAPVGTDISVPLAYPQEQLWFLDQLLQTTQYQIGQAISLDGLFDVTIFSQALEQLVFRQNILRTYIIVQNNQPILQVADTVPIDIEYKDISHLDSHEQKQAILNYTSVHHNIFCDLSHPPLWKIGLFACQKNRHVIVFMTHHILFDAWSLAILIQELGILYHSILNRQPPNLPDLPIQYRDFAYWQRDTLKDERLAGHIEYWQNRLNNITSAWLPWDNKKLRPPAPTSTPPTSALSASTPPTSALSASRPPTSAPVAPYPPTSAPSASYPPASTPEVTAQHIPMLLDKTLTRQLQDLSRQHQATLFATLLAILHTLIYRYSGLKNLVIGIPMANRSRPETQNLMGMFVNTLPLCNPISSRISFSDYLKQVRDNMLGALEHQEVPLEKLVQVLCTERQLGQNPFFNVVMVLQNIVAGQNIATQQWQSANLSLSVYPLENITAKFDITLTWTEHNQELHGDLEYHYQIAQSEFMQQFARHFIRLAKSAIASPQTPLDELRFLTESEFNFLVNKARAVQSYPVTECIHQRFSRIAQQYPDHIAVKGFSPFPFQQTYQELDRLTNRMAWYLQQQYSIGPETLVGVFLDRGEWLIPGILAILKAGSAYVPIDAHYPKDRIAFIIQDTNMKLILTQSNLGDQLPETVQRIYLDQESAVWQNLFCSSPPCHTNPQNLAYMIYTSGSTGTPKGVLIPHSHVMRLFFATQDIFSFTKHDVWTLFHSCAFDFSVWEIWGALLYGGRLVVVPYSITRDTMQFYHLLIQEHVTVLNQTPSAFRQLSQYAVSVHTEKLDTNTAAPGNTDTDIHGDTSTNIYNDTGTDIHNDTGSDIHTKQSRHFPYCTIIFGGEALEISSLSSWMDYFGDDTTFVNMYGITETTVHVTYRKITRSDLSSPSLIGIPLADMELYLLDQNQEPVPLGVAGEIYVGGSGLSRGYWNHPELTSEKFIPHLYAQSYNQAATPPSSAPATPPSSAATPQTNSATPQTSSLVGARLYKSGDLGRYLFNGELEYLGRADQQVKIRGFRVELSEIQATIVELEEVQDCVVMITENDVTHDKQLVAYIIPSSPTENFDWTKLRQNLAQKLPYYMIPAYFFAIEQIPLTPHGKCDYKALAKIKVSANMAQQQPDTHLVVWDHTEETIAQIWTKVLGHAPVSKTQNFFSAGGHSLLATQFLLELRQKFAQDFPLRMLFESPNIELLAKAIAKRQTSPSVPIQHTQQENTWPISLGQERLWFLQQLDPSSPAYNMVGIFSMIGKIQPKVLQYAFRILGARHRVLCSVYPVQDGKAYLRFLPTSTIVLAQDDLQNLTEPVKTDTYNDLLQRETSTPFDLAVGPLLRIRLIYQTDTRATLIVVLHHIVCDGWSLEIMLREVAQIYRHLSNMPEIPDEPEIPTQLISGCSLPQLPIQYGDFAKKQRQWMGTGFFQSQLDYWKNQLAGELPNSPFLLDFQRKPLATFYGKREKLSLSPTVTNEIQKFSIEHNITLFMTILAGFSVLAHRISQATDMIFGVPISGRQLPETKNLIGFFVNTLALRIRPHGSNTFASLASQIHHTCIEAYCNQDVPYEQIVAELQPNRNLATTPIFQVMVNDLQFADQPVQLPDVEFQSLPLPAEWSKFDLTLYIHHRTSPKDISTPEQKSDQETMSTGQKESTDSVRENYLEFDIVYNSGLFRRETIQIWLQQLAVLLENACHQPETCIIELPLLRPDEAEYQQRQFYQNLSSDLTQLQFHPNPQIHLTGGHVLLWLAHAWQNYSNKIALEYNNQAMTYQQLQAETSKLTRCLETYATHNFVVAILANDRRYLVYGLIACLQAGKIFMPLAPDTPTERIQFILQQVQPDVILGEPDLISRYEDMAYSDKQKPILVSYYTWQIFSPNPVSPNAKFLSAVPAYLYFTSGSTGNPKGVLGQSLGLSHFLRWEIEGLNLPLNIRVAQLTLPNVDVALRDILAPICAGGTIVIPNDAHLVWDMEQLSDWLVQNRIHVLHCVPSLWSALLHYGHEHNFPDLRFCLMAGEVISPADVALWFRRVGQHVQLVNLYGATETNLVKCTHLITSSDIQRGYIPAGKPMPGVTIVIMKDRQKKLLAVPGECGEIFIRTPYLSLGYYEKMSDPMIQAEQKIANQVFHRDATSRSNDGNGARQTSHREDSNDGNGARQTSHREDSDDGNRSAENNRHCGCPMYQTGDWGRMTSDGTLQFLGRKDRQIKIRGLRIEPLEIEQALCKFSGIHQAIVMQHSQDTNQLVGYFTCSSEIDIFELRKFLRNHLPEYFVPTHLMAMKQFPQLPGGKIDLKNLPMPNLNLDGGQAKSMDFQSNLDGGQAKSMDFQSNLDGGQAKSMDFQSNLDGGQQQKSHKITQVSSPYQEIITTIFSQVLRKTDIVLSASFFDLGGHSLLMTQVLSRIRHVLGFDISLREFLENPSVQGVCRLAEESRQADQNIPALIHIADDKYPNGWPLSYAQERLWFLHQLQPGNPAYNMNRCLKLTGSVNLSALQASLNQLVERHSILRTVISLTPQGLIQKILPISTATVSLLVGVKSAPEPSSLQTSQVTAIITGMMQNSQTTTGITQNNKDSTNNITQNHAITISLSDIIPDNIKLSPVLQYADNQSLKLSENQSLNQPNSSTSFGSYAYDVAIEKQLDELKSATATTILGLEARKPYDLSHDILLRAVLISQDTKHHWLLLQSHHIAVDGSMDILLRDLSEIYNAICENRKAILPYLAISYHDFAVWQRKYLQGDLLQSQIQYWKQALEGAPLILNLPLDFRRPSVYRFVGKRAEFHILPDMTQKFLRISHEQQSTLFVTLLSTFALLLKQYTGQQDLLIGTPISQRDVPSLEAVVGCFVNTVILRCQLDNNPTWVNLLARIRQSFFSALQHRQVPFEILVNELQSVREPSHTPIIQAMFVVLPKLEEASPLYNLDIESVVVDPGTARLDLLVSLRQTEKGMIGAVEYNSDILAPLTIQRMIQHWLWLMETLLANPTLHIEDIPSCQTWQNQIEAWNQTSGSYPNTAIHQLFEQSVAIRPHAPALLFQLQDKYETWTYQTLNQKANCLAYQLLQLGIQQGDHVAVYMERSPYMIQAVLGILKAGATYIPLEIFYPKDRIAWIMENLKVATVITLKDQADLLRTLQNESSCIRHVLVLDAPEESTPHNTLESTPHNTLEFTPHNTLEYKNPNLPVTPVDLAYIIFTSGSTGNPKGVMVQHGQAVNVLDWINQYSKITNSDVLLFVTSLCFDLSVYDIFGTLGAGACLYIASREQLQEPHLLAKLLLSNLITIWDSAPATLGQLLPVLGQLQSSLPDNTQTSLRWVMLSGDWIPITMPDEIHKYFPAVQIISLGGATEAVIWSNYYPIQQVPSNAISIPYGKPMRNARYYVLDRFLHPCPVDVPGDLYIGGDCLSLGYACAPHLTADRFIPDPFSKQSGARMYATGDCARYRSDGNLEFLGRKDHQIKIRGFRIELGEIESILAQHPSIQQSLVMPRERKGQKYLVAYVILKIATTNLSAQPLVNISAPSDKIPTTSQPLVSSEQLKTFLRQKLPEYMIPEAWVFVEKFPLNSNGKVDRRALPEPQTIPVPADTEPRNDVERQLQKIWQKILGMQSVSIYENFFSLGGNSLMITQVLVRIEQEFQIKLKLLILLAHPNIASLAKLIVEKLSEKQADSSQPAPDQNKPAPDQNKPAPDQNKPAPDQNKPAPDWIDSLSDEEVDEMLRRMKDKDDEPKN